MSSPAPSDAENTRGDVAYRFCQDCSNLLYPREDRALNKLVYKCKACEFVQEHESGCTYRTHLSSNVQETAGVVQNVANDPTLAHSEKHCEKCGHNDAVTFQSQQRKGDTAMRLYYVCTNPTCNHVFTSA